ncbi:MAG TPA: GntR family transcriptional regulator [Bryobacteraceae bacterium]|nr:GntR family transcriptional regulator [Bryobacteraceae bacterium]
MQSTESKSKSGNSAEVSQTGRTLLNLRGMLLRGDFQPGERLSELPLVARLGVSRTPIRLALDRLAHEGLLEASPTGGFVVRAFSLEDIWDALETRGVLEGAAARLASERLEHDSELVQLREYRDELDAMIHAESDPEHLAVPDFDSYARYLDLNEAFHSEIVTLAKSAMLRRTLEQVKSIPFASPSAMVYVRSKLPRAPQILAVAHEHHRAIVEAIERKQGARAEALAREHAGMSRYNVEVALTEPSILSTVPGASLIRMPAAV